MPAPRLRTSHAVIGAIVLALPLLLAARCSLPAIEGRVLDRETRAPIAGVRVIELWRGGRAWSDVAATLATRSATTDAAGRFSFSEQSSARGGAEQPTYVFAHSSYGLARHDLPPAGDAGPPVFLLSASDAAARSALATLCASATREEWERELAREFCVRREKRLIRGDDPS